MNICNLIQLIIHQKVLEISLVKLLKWKINKSHNKRLICEKILYFDSNSELIKLFLVDKVLNFEMGIKIAMKNIKLIRPAQKILYLLLMLSVNLGVQIQR